MPIIKILGALNVCITVPTIALSIALALVGA